MKELGGLDDLQASAGVINNAVAPSLHRILR
jgi:hypothetical protein